MDEKMLCLFIGNQGSELPVVTQDDDDRFDQGVIELKSHKMVSGFLEVTEWRYGFSPFSVIRYNTNTNTTYFLSRARL